MNDIDSIHSTKHYYSKFLDIFDGSMTFFGNGLEVDVRLGMGRGGVVGRAHASLSSW
jgi:hypothetical protein